MAMGSLDRDTVNLLPGQLIMEESQDMPIFHLTHWELKRHLFNSRKLGLRLVIVMKRKIKSEMMTTYLPSALLIVITFATTFFKPFFFEAALSVNLTTMLVMTTIFISKMEGLPPTSDIKMIDIWLILCQLVPFAQVVLLTVMEYLREEEKDSLEKNDIHEQAPTKENPNIIKEDETNPKEAWNISQRELTKASSITLLSMIGKVLMHKTHNI